MDTAIFEIINKTGLQVSRFPVMIDLLTEYHFAIKSYRILQQFCAHSQKLHKNLTYSEYFIKNLNQNFRNKSRKQQEDDISRYLSILLEKDKSTEIELYYNIMFNRVSIKTAKLYLALFSEIRTIAPDLYETPQKLFKGIRVDIQKALDIAYAQLKGDAVLEAFTSSLTNHIENKGTNKSYIPGSVVVNYILLAYMSSHNNLSGVDYSSSPLKLNWSSDNSYTFRVQANKDAQNSHDDLGVLNLQDASGSALKHKAGNYVKEDFLVNKTDSESNLVKICHPYVFSNDKGDDNNDEDANGDIRKEILMLRNKLEKQKLELSLQQSMWKMILYHMRESFSTYDTVDQEFESVDRINEALSSVLNRNTEEWRSIFHDKKEYRTQSFNHQYLISALLEGFNQNLQGDLQKLNLRDGSEQFISLFERLDGVDLSGYFDLAETEQPSNEQTRQDVSRPNNITQVELGTYEESVTSGIKTHKQSGEDVERESRASGLVQPKKMSVNVSKKQTPEVVDEIKERSKTELGRGSQAIRRDSDLKQNARNKPSLSNMDTPTETMDVLKENLKKMKDRMSELGSK